MPIEDVDYLRDVSVKQSYIFLVNSADRDRVAFPTPSQYTIEFTTPFQNVIGLEVLDASIPRTMYNVDLPNCGIRFLIHDHRVDPRDYSKYVLGKMETGDYTIQTLLPALNSIMKMHLNGDSNEPIIAITAETTSNPPELKNTITFRCPYPFALWMDPGAGSTLAETLGFDLYVQPAEKDVTALERRYEPLPFLDARDYKLYHSVDLEPEIAMGSESFVFDGPRGVVRRFAISSTQKVAQRFHVTARSYLTQVFAALTTADNMIRPDSKARWSLYTDVSALPGTSMGTGIIPVSYVDGGLSDPESPVRILLEPGWYWILLESDDNNTFVFYNDIPTTQLQGACVQSNDAGVSWESVDTIDGIHFELSIRVVLQDEYHKIEAPGIFSLVGEKYVVLRCPEIEENSYRSLAFSRYCLGLAKFRLGIVGYSENRLDFSRTPLREFHPIGKLSRMTFRFETAAGLLYDFKGVNHNITFAIHYLEPSQKQKFTQPILNPNYNGDLIAYHYTQEAREEDSDDQEFDYGTNPLEDYKAAEARNLPEQVRERDLQALYEVGDVAQLRQLRDLDLREFRDQYAAEQGILQKDAMGGPLGYDVSEAPERSTGSHLQNEPYDPDIDEFIDHYDRKY